MLKHFFKNPFLNDKVSEDNFSKISLTHIERLRSNNQNNEYTLLIDATEPLYTGYRKSLAAESKEISSKQGKTISVDDMIERMKEFVSRKEGVIADKFEKGTPTYEEFFPRGTHEYTIAVKKNIELLFTRFKQVCEKYGADIGEAVGVEANNLLERFIELRKQQLGGIGGVKELDSESEAERKMLAIRLYRNLLFLLDKYAEDTARVHDFFDESMFKKSKEKEADNPSPPSTT